MEIQVTSTKENQLFSRKEISATIVGFEGTPSRKEVIEAFAKEAHAKPDCVSIEKIEHKFGSKQAILLARVYESAEKLAAVEHPYVAKRGKPKEEKAPEKK